MPLLTVLKEVAPVRVPGRLPLYQVWFDIQPEAFEGDFKLEGADIKGAPKVCKAPAGCVNLLSLHHLQSLFTPF